MSRRVGDATRVRVADSRRRPSPIAHRPRAPTLERIRVRDRRRPTNSRLPPRDASARVPSRRRRVVVVTRVQTVARPILRRRRAREERERARDDRERGGDDRDVLAERTRHRDGVCGRGGVDVIRDRATRRRDGIDVRYTMINKGGYALFASGDRKTIVGNNYDGAPR